MMFNMNNDRKEKRGPGRRALIPFACLCLLGAGLFPALAQNTVPAPDAQQAATPAADAVPQTDAAVTPQAPDMPVTPADDATVETVTATVDEADSLDETVLLATAEAKSHVRDSSLLPESLTTLFFTAWQHALLQEAKIGFNTSLAASGPGGASGSATGRAPGLREISLGGIAFADTSKWTVWLNGVRVTPNAIPSEVLDIKVSRAYIDLKWFDGYTNKIYPIRLRPQERFNLDSRIFLPGSGDGAM